MAISDNRLFGDTHRDLPGVVVDGVVGPAHFSRRGELVTASLHGNKLQALADEGSYFVATNATPGTALAGIAAADGLDDLESLVFLRNDATESEGTRIYLDYILLRTVAVGTNGTNFAVAMHLDTGTTRRGTGGTAITPQNTNMQSTRTASCTLVVGAVATAAASASQRLVSHGPMRSVIKVAGDTYLFTFGSSEKAALSPVTTAGTAVAHVVRACPPIVLGPTDQFLLHEYAASQSVAATYEFEMGFWAR